MGSVRALAPAKVNVSLRIRAADASGMHPLSSIAQSISWYDELSFEPGDDDMLEVVGADLPLDGDNLVWRAVEALRKETGAEQRVHIRLLKRLPTAAGLGGGSSDAAAAMRAYTHLTRPCDELARIGAAIGADVPFCLSGGTQLMEGHGEILTPVRGDFDDYWFVVAVPPVELPTPRVYAVWDEMDGPTGPEVPARMVPPSLRPLGPLANDLYPAALRCAPEVGDWQEALSERWERPAMMSGSGPSFFGFFADEHEAREAVLTVPAEARATAVARPIEKGAHLDVG